MSDVEHALTTAMRRARKRLARSIAHGEAATTERARLRHMRRENNARRYLADLGRTWEGFAMQTVPD